ncbi:hypothetical protein F7725_017610 [Dissostichus mawsoni]|uniref:Zinc finger and BTB domain containing 40 n=1 Tax=Dissostichus mawsoni TaxID=36200 RepID=A0A7J5Z836_DISMA|nr:hypothetical protein F7725_017610 [Dissostichus mawsoni]
MMELPNYSSQLMQQLWALRREGHLCDCTILVGDSPHRAHKLVLAASSMLFRSLLEGSDTISIDTAMVSSQEFGCLLDMVYTGKLPLGKHNVSRIVAAADSLQMFDVAVGFKNILTSLVNQQTPVHSTHTPSLPVISQVQSMNTDVPLHPARRTRLQTRRRERLRVRLKLQRSRRVKEAVYRTQWKKQPTAAQQSNGPAAGVLEHSSELVELLSNMPSLVCECCEEADPYPALEKLLSLEGEQQCPQCPKKLANQRALQQHRAEAHRSTTRLKKKMYVCQYCKAVFAQSIELTRHVRTHTGDRPYVCRECGKGYSQASGLTVHLHTFHNLLEPHDCQKCCLSFSSLEEHRQHIHELHPKEFQKTNHPDMFANHTRQLKTLCQCDRCQCGQTPGSRAPGLHGCSAHLSLLPCCAGGEEELQEHLSSQHLEASSCPFCSLLCCSQLELQEHLLSCHMEAQEEQGGEEEQEESSSHTETAAHPAGNEGAESEAQQVFVALAGGGEVNMYELLNSSVTIICEDKPAAADS